MRPHGLSQVAQEVAEESLENPASASDAVVARVAKRDGPAMARHMRGAEAAAKARAKREETVAQSSTQPRQGRDEHLAPVRKPGIMLVRLQDEEARRKAQQLRFQLTSDPLDFVAKVVQVPAYMRKGSRPSSTQIFRCVRGSLRLSWEAFTPRHRIFSIGANRRAVSCKQRGFLCGCISRSRGRVAHTVATFESHRCGARKLLQALPVRTQVVHVFQKDREDNTAYSEEGLRSRHAGRAS